MMKTKPLLQMIIMLFTLVACRADRLTPVPPTSTPSVARTPIQTFTPLPSSTPVPTPTASPLSYLEIGERAIINGDWDQATTQFQAALDSSNDPETRSAALLGLGRAALYLSDYATSLDRLRQIVENYPETSHLAHAHFFLGQTYNNLQRYGEAAQAYQIYLDLRPELIDFYVQVLRGDMLFANGAYWEAIAAYYAALDAPRVQDGIEQEIKIAQGASALGDFSTALGIYTDIYNRSNNDYIKAQVDYLSGQAHIAMGQPEQGYAAYLDAVENYPLSYNSYLGLVALVEAGIPVNELDRGLVDYFANQYGVAIAAFDRYIETNPGGDLSTARYYKGLSLRALSNYPEAISEWDRVILDYPGASLWDEAWEQKAYTEWAFLDQYPEAVQTLLDFVSTAPNHPRAPEFLFDAARVSERDEDLQRAAKLWERTAETYPGSEYAFRSLFLSGISHYRRGDYSASTQSFKQSLTLSEQPENQAAAHLWIGKCELAQGEATAARAAWEKAAIADPTGYYSERARDLLLDRPPFAPPSVFDRAIDWGDEYAQAIAWMKIAFSLPENTDLQALGPLEDDLRLRRGTELWNLGMLSQARAEFESLRQSVESDPVSNMRLAWYLFELGVYRSAILASRQVLNLAAMDDASTLTAPPFFNHIRFGTYYGDLVFPIAEAYDFHPLLLFSVIRQESFFEGFVQSSAGARGLMQIIPSTGQGIYELNGWPPGYTADDLYRPKVSITYGADYLDDQRTLFEGDLYGALAAYNGGPGNALAWKELAPDDPDLFLEVIRFEETRRYIRGIYEFFNIYRRLYDRAL